MSMDAWFWHGFWFTFGACWALLIGFMVAFAFTAIVEIVKLLRERFR